MGSQFYTHKLSSNQLPPFACHSPPFLSFCQGVLVDEYVLDKIRELMNMVRNCNVTLQWVLLHRTAAQKKYKVDT